MKKKIIFMLINMNVGGTEKALLNMISEIPLDEYEVTVLLLEEYGGFLPFLPEGVQVRYVKHYDRMKEILNQPPLTSAWALWKRGALVSSLALAGAHLLSKLLNNRSLYFAHVLRDYPMEPGEYDVAVAYAGPMDFISYFVCSKINASKRVQWVHFDITKIGFNTSFAGRYYPLYDKVFVVSQEAKEKLLHEVTGIRDKTDVFLNMVSPELIRMQAEEGRGFTDGFEGTRIVTVGRLAMEKGQDLAIRVLARLIKEGYRVKWYCIGEGTARASYEALVHELGVEEHFVFLGSDPNPYPYMAQCDVYVQPSRHEGYCITLAEARCLNRPIVTTNFTGAKEQIRDGETGIIVAPEEEPMYEAIVRLLEHRELGERFMESLARADDRHSGEMKKLYACLVDHL
jgi:glycosyltransferase involved in cell wall biosynthesis